MRGEERSHELWHLSVCESWNESCFTHFVTGNMFGVFEFHFHLQLVNWFPKWNMNSWLCFSNQSEWVLNGMSVFGQASVMPHEAFSDSGQFELDSFRTTEQLLKNLENKVCLKFKLATFFHRLWQSWWTWNCFASRQIELTISGRVKVNSKNNLTSN